MEENIDSYFTDYDSSPSRDDIEAILSSPAIDSFTDSIGGSPNSFDESINFGSDFLLPPSNLQDFTPSMVGPESWLSDSLARNTQTTFLPVQEFLPFAPVVTQIPPPVSPVASQIPKQKVRQELPPETKNPRATKRRKTEPTPQPKDGPAIPDNLTAAFEAADRGQMVLSKEELLNLSSVLHEELLARIRARRDLTPAEKQDAKRHRRLIKNRESAQASRQRKKTYVEILEKQVADLKGDKDEMSDKISNLTAENLYLKKQVESLQAALANKGMTSVLNHPAPSFRSSNFGTTIPPINATGLVFMILLFSFGLFFGNIQLLNQDFKSEPTTAIPGRIYMRDEYKQLSNSKGVDSLFEDQTIPFVGRLQEKLAQQQTTVPSVTQSTEPQIQANESESVPEEINSVSEIDWNPSATYLFCPSVEKILPPKTASVGANDESTLVFLIPPSSLGASEGEKTLLEVTCQVANVKTVKKIDFGSEEINYY